MIGHDVALYIHVPFCASRCPYCDFNTYAGLEGAMDRYIDALQTEIRSSRQAGERVSTVYLGGGTPTLLRAARVRRVLRTIHETFRLEPDAEITVEANPTSIDASVLGAVRQAGANRLSIGFQSLRPTTLLQLGRRHSVPEALAALAAGRAAGFANVSIDLMFAAPGQTLAHWREELRRAAALGVEHISLYGLTVEAGTPFARLHAEGKLLQPSDSVQARMYEAASGILGSSGYEPYEISNFALPGRRSRHNQVYWRNHRSMAFGAGAASYSGGQRCVRVLHPNDYVRTVLGSRSAIDHRERLARDAAAAETAMLALRTCDGLSIPSMERRFGEEIVRALLTRIANHIRAGRLRLDGDRLRLSTEARVISDSVFVDLIP